MPLILALGQVEVWVVYPQVDYLFRDKRIAQVLDTLPGVRQLALKHRIGHDAHLWSDDLLEQMNAQGLLA